MSRSQLLPAALLVALLPAGCIDSAHVVSGPAGRSEHLSGLGYFVGDVAAQQPAPGVVAYDVNAPLYADGARKRRFVVVPAGAAIHAQDGRWEVPVGTVLIKTFSFPRDERDAAAGEQLVETRFLVRTEDGYDYATYVWDDAQADAVTSGGNVDVPVDYVDASGAFVSLSFHVPGTSQCGSCHAGRALGWRTAQLDHAGSFGDGTSDQIAHLVAAGVVDAVPPAATVALVDPLGAAPLDARARSYLDANCAHCHADEAGSGARRTNVFLDYASTAAPSSLCRVVAPGEPDASKLIRKMLGREGGARMPAGPTRVPDGRGIEVLREWIRAMPPEVCP